MLLLLLCLQIALIMAIHNRSFDSYRPRCRDHTFDPLDHLRTTWFFVPDLSNRRGSCPLLRVTYSLGRHNIGLDLSRVVNRALLAIYTLDCCCRVSFANVFSRKKLKLKIPPYGLCHKRESLIAPQVLVIHRPEASL